MAIKTASSSRFYSRLSRKSSSNASSLRAQINLTYRCNLRCVHCFIPRPGREMSTRQVLTLLDRLQAAGILNLTLSGGEIFVRRDWRVVYRHARSLGFLTSIFTNATLVNKNVADALAALPPESIEVTINGITENTYEKVTGVQGSFRQAIRGVNLLAARSLPLVIKCNGMTINSHEILAIKRFSEELLGKKFFRCDLVLYPGLRGGKRPMAHRLSCRQICDIQYSDRDMLRFCEDGFKRAADPERLRQGYLFPCGLTALNIDPLGKLRLCDFIPEPAVDALEGDIRERYNRLRRYFLGLKITRHTRCSDCAIRRLCRQCPGRALAETGDMEKPVEFFCRYAHMQKEWHDSRA